MNTIICISLLACLTMAYASALPAVESGPENLAVQITEDTPMDKENLQEDESRWGYGGGGGWGRGSGGWGHGGGWGRGGGWGHGGRGWGHHGGGWGHYGGGWGRWGGWGR